MKKLAWIIDYYFLYFLYNPNKIETYHKMMRAKWGDRYTR